MDVAAFLDSLPEARDSFRLRNQAVSDLVRGVARHYYPGLYLFGRPGTGKTFEIEEIMIAQFRDGKISRIWRVADVHSMLRQLGA